MNLFSRHIKGLFDFTGRENRQPFWLWVLITYGIQTGASMILMIPMVIVMMQTMRPLSEADPDYLNAHPEIAKRLFVDTMGPMMTMILIMVAVSILIFVVLLAAATVRRLHDTNRSGWWAAPYFAFVVIMPLGHALVFPRFFEAVASIQPDMPQEQVNAAMAPLIQMWALMMGLGLVGFVLMIVLVVFCCLAGTSGPNRYGEDPLPPPPVAEPFV